MRKLSMHWYFWKSPRYIKWWEKINPARYRKCVYNASFCLQEGENENTEYIGGDVCILIADSLFLYSWNQYNIVKQLSSN